MRNLFILSFFVFFNSLYAEVSALGAGSLDSGNPYGLTESEKMILENKKQLKYQEQKISDLSEQIDGMRSVIDSISSKLGRTGERISEVARQKEDLSKNDIQKINSEIEELKVTQKNNYEKINNLLMKLSSMIDKINSDYVSKAEFDALSLKKVKKAKTYKEPVYTQNRAEMHMNNSQKLKTAIGYFRKSYYTKSYPFFKELADKSYKPATTNYYLGEISYYKKRYKDAIVFYKKSVSYYDKASYMPTLLLHTGISFEKLGDDDNKEKFLNALLNSYPNSAEANIARSHLN